MEGLTRFSDPQVMSFEDLRALGRTSIRSTLASSIAAIALREAGRSRHLGLYLGHHGHAQGGDAQPPQLRLAVAAL